MGMFDYVDYSAPCPMCSAVLTGWQTKDAANLLEDLTPTQVWKQSGRQRILFYANCDQCGTWVEICTSSGALPYTHEDFEAHRAGAKLRRRRGPVVAADETEGEWYNRVNDLG